MHTIDLLSNILINFNLFKKLNNDLIQYILLYNFNWATKIIIKYYRKNIIYKIKELSSMYYSIHKQTYYINNSSSIDINSKNFCIKENILTRKDIFNLASLCNCCSRHSVNKPKKLLNINLQPIDKKTCLNNIKDILENFKNKDERRNFINNYNIDKINCKCTCRQISRFICRDITI